MGILNFSFIKKINFHFKKPIITYTYFTTLFVLLSILDVIGLGLIGPYISILFTDGKDLEKLAIKYFNISIVEHKNYYLYLISILLLFVFIFKSLFAIFINYLIFKFSANTQLQIRSRLLNEFLNIPYDIYIKRNSSEFLNYIGNLSARCGEVIMSFLKIISDTLIIFFILILLAITNIYIFIFLILLFPIVIFLYDFILKNKIFNYGKEVAFFQQITFKNITELFGAFKENIVINKKEFFTKYILKGFQKDAEIETKINTLRIIPKFFLETLILVICVSSILLIIYFNQQIEEYLIIISIFAVSLVRIVPLASTLMSSLSIMSFGKDGLDKVYNELIKNSHNNGFRNKNITDKNLKDFNFTSLKLKNFSFKYNLNEKNIFENSNLLIKKNDKFGISGPSGTGKTTLVDIILGLFKITEGDFIINDKIVDKNLIERFRSKVSYIPQQIYLMDSSILTNITFKEHINPTENQKLFESLKKARLDEFVSNLKEGIHTEIGERGIRISGGQRQRIALARAFYFNKQIIFLDESTNQLDAETEKKVITDLMNVSNDLTLIIITHKKEILRLCKKIIYLKDGKILEN